MKYEDSSIKKAIEIGTNHIDNFKLDSDEGTKRTKAKFRSLAITQRNEYVNKQIDEFSKLQEMTFNEIKERYNKLIPEDKTALYNELENDMLKMYDLVKLTSCMSDSFKLKIDYLLAKINNDTSLEDLNDIIKQFIDKMGSLGIELSINDFKYTMFTEKYMSAFFENTNFEELKNVFEKLYFNCPDIKLQLKMNLVYIISKYSHKLKDNVSKTVTIKCNENNVSKDLIIDKYIDSRTKCGTMEAKDEYMNTKLFLDNKYKIDDYVSSSPMRNKNYELFLGDNYGGLDSILKERYNNSLLDLYLTLNELKKYYTYSFIIDDLLARYKNRENAKNEMVAKKKEIDSAEKTRIKLYHDYVKATGEGLFAKVNETKQNDSMMKINEQVRIISKLNDEYKDLCLTNNLNTLNESCTLYDLFMISLSSFTFLEKCFIGKEEFVGELEDIINDYLRFLYNPVNAFIRKINALTDFNICTIITDKFRLLDIILTDNMITSDSIDATIDSLKSINIIQNVDKSDISFEDIKILCEMDRILSISKE